MRKRQCVLCEDGKILTDAPKDKAVCHACARNLIEGECHHGISCTCPCHENPDILHFMPCCYPTSCDLCEKEMDPDDLEDHLATCHKSLSELLA